MGLRSALSRLVRSRYYLACSLALALVLVAASSVQILMRIGQWPPTFASAHPSLVITGPGSATPTTIDVTVLGAVITPGAYPLADGSRVRDVIAAAGGLQTTADISQLDVTAPVTDGETLYVPHIGETPPVLVNGKVNINVATATELHNALDISVSEAKRIVSYREKHGRYTAVSDLLLVPISQTIFDRIKALVTV